MFVRRCFIVLLLASPLSFAAEQVVPVDDPMASLKQPWTAQLLWKNVINITTMPGNSPAEKLAVAQDKIVAMGGGVVFFPAGKYEFAEHIRLKPGVILRGESPAKTKKAIDDGYTLTTHFVFPKYAFKAEGEGTPISTAFKGIYADDPAKSANIGVVDLDINRGHIHFDDAGPDAKFAAGKNRFVYGCILRNTAVADPAVPNAKIGQHPWQRFTKRHFGAIDLRGDENVIVANCRLPKSADDNFTQNGYVLNGKGNKPTSIDGVVFDYDNRPGIYVNHYGIGGAGGTGETGTPETFPHGFRKGNVIHGNFVYATGRTAIGFCGDGTICSHNVIRFVDNVWRPTTTGQGLTFGSSTNDNRAVEMRGWRWKVTHNDYLVYKNLCFDKIYRINDGEGLMHEGHVNSNIKDSVLSFNKGNTYLSMWHVGGIDGFVVEGNDIRIGDKHPAIYVVADRGKKPFEIKGVVIKGNTASSNIVIGGSPAANNAVVNNVYNGPATGKIINRAQATVENNKGFTVADKE